jgi:hypothetical protein
VRDGPAIHPESRKRRRKRNWRRRWPSRQERRDLYSHDLTALAALAGLEQALLEAIAAGSNLGTSWLIAKDWSIETRYDPRPFPPRRARDMLHAVDTEGLLKWLLTP